MAWFSATGIVQYFDGNERPHKAWALVDQELARFYRSLIPKHYAVQPQRYPAHISFVRKIRPANLEVWGKHEGLVVSFQYENVIYNDEIYWWLNAVSPDIEKIRNELGMPPVGPTTWSPDGRHRFHISIANTKGRT